MKTIIHAYNWKWLELQDGILDSWFNDIPEAVKHTVIKSSTERDVFKIKFNSRNYFVKYSHPSSILQKIRALFCPKLIKEYNTVKLLQKYNISTPVPVAAGYRGAESILITEAVENAYDVRTFWFSNYSDLSVRKKFLSAYALFLKSIFKTGLFHPDFHPGNILVQSENNQYKFYLIDTYGIKQYNRIPFKKFFTMLTITGAMRGELTDSEAVTVIREITGFTHEKASDLWKSILIHETVKTEKLWQKRRLKIFQNSKYTVRIDKSDITLLVRKDLTGIPCLPPEEIRKLQEGCLESEKYTITEHNSYEAENIWSSSFRMEFHRIPGKKPSAWIKQNKNGNDLLVYKQEKSSDKLIPDEDIILRKRILEDTNC